MKLLDKISPKFLLEIDQNLLLKSPTLWILKIHYLLFWQVCFMALSFIISYFLPQSLGHFPNIPILLTLYGVCNALIILLWVYYSHQFDLRTRNIGKPRLYEQARIASYVLAIVFFLIGIGANIYTLHYKTTQILDKKRASEFYSAQTKINYYERHVSDIAKGYYYIYLPGTLNGEAIKHIHYYSQDSILLLCKEIGLLNQQYGDGQLYSGETIFASITDTLGMINNHYYSYLPGENTGLLNELFYNTYKLNNAFSFVENFYTKIYDETIAYILFICFLVGILILFITYFKFFGIYQIITGLLVPNLLFVLIVFGAYIVESLLGYSWSDTVDLYIIILLIMSIALYYLGFSFKFSSKKRIVLLQTITLILPTLLLIFYFEKIETYVYCLEYIGADGLLEGYDCIGCRINPEYENCLSYRQNFENLWAIALGLVFLFIALPAYLKILYRQYYLPIK